MFDGIGYLVGLLIILAICFLPSVIKWIQKAFLSRWIKEEKEYLDVPSMEEISRYYDALGNYTSTPKDLEETSQYGNNRLPVQTLEKFDYFILPTKYFWIKGNNIPQSYQDDLKRRLDKAFRQSEYFKYFVNKIEYNRRINEK